MEMSKFDISGWRVFNYEIISIQKSNVAFYCAVKPAEIKETVELFHRSFLVLLRSYSSWNKSHSRETSPQKLFNFTVQLSQLK